MTLAQRMAVMDRGRVAQVGAPRDVYEHPASRFVAGFIGTANLFEGTVAGQDNGLVRVQSPAAGCAVAVRHAGTLSAGTAACVAVRPEKLRLGDAGCDNGFAATVEEVAFRGEATLCRARLATGHALTLSLPNRARAGGDAPRAGAAVRIGFAADDAVLLTS